MNIPEIRDGLKARLATVSGLRCYDTIPDDIAPPAAVIVPDDPFVPDPDGYWGAFRGGAESLRFRVVLFASRTSMNSGQDLLDRLLSTGTNAPGSAVEALHDTTIPLGGSAIQAVVRGAEGYGTTDVGSITYLKVDLLVEVMAERI